MTTPPRKRASAKSRSGKGRAADKAPAPAKGTAGKEAPDDAQEKDPSGGTAAADGAGKAAEKNAATAPPADEAKPDPKPVSAPPPVRPAGAARALAWVTLSLGLAVGAAALTWPWWSERLGGAFPFLAVNGQDPAISRLAGRVETLEQQTRSLETEKSGTLEQLEQERARFQSELKTMMARLAKVEKAVAEARDLVKAADAPAGSAVAVESLKALADRLAELEQDAAKGSAAAPAAAGPDPELKSALETMAARLKRLERETDGKDAGDAAARAIVLAVAQLRDALREGRPFAADLEALKAIADGRPAIAQSVSALAPQAAHGVPSLAVLRTRFASLAGPIVTAAGAADGDGWLAEAAAKLASLVTVRRVGDAAPEGSVDALVARVDALLAAGDLSSAVETLKLLTGKAGEVVAPWLKAAEARLAAEKAVANLHVHALSLLAPAKAGG
ncbi:MAG: hypothetical protein COW30_15310 [Rhodospirillales bacterium CG15_BIG_FIL_POST_REV_8_21_14_020_66_15]|nr:MAG: hypothetical protein COW30_15310 [Rhodospirillales bacterium CG15_BIG_FIL_POST_REV_8_21_14_020_66_15]